MRSLTLPVLALLSAFPSAAIAEASDVLFLNCETTQRSKLNDGVALKEMLSLKIDLKNQNIYEYQTDLGSYKSLCGSGSVNDGLKTGQGLGKCTISDTTVWVNSDSVGLASRSRTFTIYRASGRIFGRESWYSGLVPSIEEILDRNGKKPVADFDINGTCRIGPDMSKAKKVF
jgi:hypothetical protein